MLISISGAPCTGKTTLWSYLSQRFGRRCSCYSDVARASLEILGPEFPENDQAAFQNFLGIRQLLNETEVELNKRPAIFDKSLIDTFAYWKILVKSDLPDWSRRYFEKRYALTLILDPNDLSETDAIELHDMHWHLRNQIDNEISNVAKHLSHNTLRISGPLAERQQAIFDAIDSMTSRAS